MAFLRDLFVNLEFTPKVIAGFLFVTLPPMLISLHHRYLRPYLAKRQIERDFGADSFDAEQIRVAATHYIPPDCSQLDPAGAEDDRKMVSLRQPLIPLMDLILGDPSYTRHFLLLADSGMGKTSFLLNYYLRNRNRRRKHRFRISVVPLGRANALASIAEIQHKKDTILFLDAFDEDTLAIEDHRTRLVQIMEACEDFRRVVISCRTQFFAHDEEIPKQTGIARVHPRRAGERRYYEFQKLYLAPFSDAQISEYLRGVYPLSQWIRRRESKKVVVRMGDLATRPMLLALVPELVESKTDASELFELYEFMVDKWLLRESDWISPDLMGEISRTIAVDLYLHRSERGAERIDLAALSALVDLSKTEIEKWKLTGRSLLNRDAVGNYKFAHRSIMEYLIICAAISGDDRALNVAWTDMMRLLFVSWANVAAARGSTERLQVLLLKNLRPTGLFPLLEHPRTPAALRKTEILSAARGIRALALYRSLGGIARGLYLREHLDGDSAYLCDMASDAVFCVQIDWRRVSTGKVDTDTCRLFDMTRADVARQCEGLNSASWSTRKDWRAPTLEEFDILLVANERLGFLDPEGTYWISDTTEKGEHLIASLGTPPSLIPAGATLVGDRGVALPTGGLRKVAIISVPSLGFRSKSGIYDTSLAAKLVLVSVGGAADFSIVRRPATQ